MRIFIRKILSKLLNKQNKQKLKEVEYKTKKRLISKLPVLDKNSIKKILIDEFNIKKGDNLFIHASLDMLNTTLTPLEILNILLEIVGDEGSISVPTFIRYSSKEWMEMPKEFNIKRTPSGMGIFSERVRRYKYAHRSIHPTKSIASIGKISNDVTSEHHLSDFAFGEKSPFFKLMKNHNVKILGLGAPMSYLSMVHVIEDIFSDKYPINVNETTLYEKNCIINPDEIIKVNTYVHNLKILAKANPQKFIKKYVDKNKYKIYNHYLTPFFIVEGKELLNELEIQMTKGNTIYD